MRLSKPLIAAVGGYAVAGGLELALLADLRVVEESSIMGIFSRRFGRYCCLLLLFHIEVLFCLRLRYAVISNGIALFINCIKPQLFYNFRVFLFEHLFIYNNKKAW